MDNTLQNQLEENVNGPERPRTQQEPGEIEYYLQEMFYGQMADLVGFLLLKYRSNELTTLAEMVDIALNNNPEFFPIVFIKACECMQLVFGIQVKEIHPQVPVYALVTTLGLSYDGISGPEYSLPKTGLLVIVLGIIIREGNYAYEEEIWETLSMMGVTEGIEHFIYGEPRALLTNVWVQEQYLQYQQVPGSYPARYVFLWGPRAYAETSERKVIEFWIRATGMNLRRFPVQVDNEED